MGAAKQRIHWDIIQAMYGDFEWNRKMVELLERRSLLGDYRAVKALIENHVYDKECFYQAMTLADQGGHQEVLNLLVRKEQKNIEEITLKIESQQRKLQIQSGYYIYLLSKLPGKNELIRSYKNKYIFIDQPFSLYHVSSEGVCEKIKIDDTREFLFTLRKLRASRPDRKLRLSREQAEQLITSNGGCAVINEFDISSEKRRLEINMGDRYQVSLEEKINQGKIELKERMDGLDKKMKELRPELLQKNGGGHALTRDGLFGAPMGVIGGGAGALGLSMFFLSMPVFIPILFIVVGFSLSLIAALKMATSKPPEEEANSGYCHSM